MALPLAFWGAAQGAALLGLAFRAVTSPFGFRAAQAVASSASTIGSSVSNSFDQAARVTGQVYDWATGEPAQAPHVIQLDQGNHQTQNQTQYHDAPVPPPSIPMG